MAITDFAKEYHEKMFPGYVSKFLETDPEFIERRKFMEGMFKARQNSKSDCPTYEYLYLEEDGPWYSQLVDVIGKFF